MSSNFDHVIQKTRQYWTVDGLSEIVLGALFLTLGLYFFAQVYFGQDSLVSNLMQSGLILVIIGAFLGGKRLTAFLKARITYPRTGYVAYRKPDRKNKWLSIGFAILVATAGILSFLVGPVPLDWMPAITGLLGGVFFFIIASQLNLLRFYTLSLISLIIGAGLAVAGFGNLLGFSLYYFLLGLVLLLSGSLTLRNYLLDNRALPSEE